MRKRRRSRSRLSSLARWIAAAILFAHLPFSAFGAPRSVEAPTTATPSILLDAHNDVLLRIADSARDLGKPISAAQVDIEKCRAGGVNCLWFAAWIDARRYPGREAVARATRLLGALRQQAQRYPEDLALCVTAGDVRRAAASGKIAALMAIEGGVAIDEDLSLIQEYRRQGVRLMTLTWRENLSWAGSSQSKNPSMGLSALGREIVREMNRVGMIIDLSHASDQTFYDVLQVSTRPVVCSHSNARALSNHPRNVTDDMLRLLRDNGGVIGVTYAHEFLEQYPAQNSGWLSKRRFGTLEDVLNQIDHIVRVAGIDHVGLGSDWEGGMRSATGLESAAKMPKLIEGLRRRNYSEQEIAKIAGENFLRVLEANEPR